MKFCIIFILSAYVQEIQGQEISIPTCPVDEFLTSNGTDLICRSLPETSFCDCPDLVPPICDNASRVDTFPLPPPGCEQFQPPTLGAFVCLRRPTVIHCSVLCDHRFEFSSAPRSPYTCGEETGFVWLDVTGSSLKGGLPNCTGFRHRLQTLFDDQNYLPSPCHGLSEDSIFYFLLHFLQSLEKNGIECEECGLENIFLRCPAIPASAQFISDLNRKVK